MKTLPILIVAIVSLFLSPSCSKKSNSQTCHIITITDQFGTNPTTTYNLTYDNQGRISTLQFSTSSGSTSRVFTYSGSTLIMTTTTTSNTARDSITLNSDGLAASDYYSDNTSTNNTIYTYSGTEVQKAVSTQGANPPVTTTFTWSNGDLSGFSGSGSTSSFTYNSKGSETGDYWQILQLVNYGAPFVRTAHQLAAYQTGTTIENINYTYDNTGKITAVTGTQGSTVENIAYQYQCN